jgi:hypothetical protein
LQGCAKSQRFCGYFCIPKSNPMRTHFYTYSILFLLAIVISSCNWLDSEPREPSSNPHFFSLKFAKNDSIPKLETAVFTLEYDSLLRDSIIVNLDSLPHLTRIDSVFPTFTFVSTSASFILLRDSLGVNVDTLALTGNDTINFNRVVGVKNIAENKLAKRIYPVKVNVHQVEPELFHWKRITASVYTHSASVQKALLFNGKFFFYASTGVNNYLYTSVDGIDWTTAPLSGLPRDIVDLRSLVEFNNALFYVHENGDMYSSPDGVVWAKVPVSVGANTSMINLLFGLEDKLWGVVRNSVTDKYYFATSTNGVSWTIGEPIPANFPVGDFAALSFSSRTNKPKAIVVGGYSAAGELLRNTWSVERNINNVYRWVDFSIQNTTLVSLAGASLVPYNNKILLFGGMDANVQVIDPFYLESVDEGFSWRGVDTTYNVIYDAELNVSYEPRSYQSVVYEPESKSLYLFGGRTSTVYSDVWRGKLNRLSFIRQ